MDITTPTKKTVAPSQATGVRGIAARVDLELQRMTKGFSAYGLRAGGPIALDPFLNLDDFVMSEPTFPPHPHAGFSAVTYMFEDSDGAFINRDSLGDRSRIEPGAFHWTQAARGMMHEEIPEHAGTRCHGLQMFLNLQEEHKLAPPRAFHVAAADVPTVRPADGVRVRVLAGSFGEAASPLADLLTKVQFLDLHLEEGASVDLDARSDETAFCLVVGGQGHAGTDEAGVGLVAHSAVGFANDGDHVRLVGGPGGLHVLFASGAPLREPVVFGGPFAMTNAKALDDARQRFQRGEMGNLSPSF